MLSRTCRHFTTRKVITPYKTVKRKIIRIPGRSERAYRGQHTAPEPDDINADLNATFVVFLRCRCCRALRRALSHTRATLCTNIHAITCVVCAQSALYAFAAVHDFASRVPRSRSRRNCRLGLNFSCPTMPL